MENISLQAMAQQLRDKKAQVEASVAKFQMEVANQTAQVNPPGESAISQAGVNSGQNDAVSVDVSIKREVDSESSESSESESESDTDDEVQVKKEPNEEEDITGRSEEQTENASNSNDNRETNDSPNDHSNEAANEQESNDQARMIDGGGQAINNQEQMVIAMYSSPPPASPPNAEQSINSVEFNSRSNADNQADLSDVIDNQVNHVDAEDVADGALEDGENVDNMEMEVNHHHDGQEEANPGIVALLEVDDEYVDMKSEPTSDVEEQMPDGAGDWRNEPEDYARADAERLCNLLKQSRPQRRVNPNRRPSGPIKEEIVDENRLALVLYQPPAGHRDDSGSIEEQVENYLDDDDGSDNEDSMVDEESDHLEDQDVTMSGDEAEEGSFADDDGNDSNEDAVMDETDDDEDVAESMSDIEDEDENDNEEEAFDEDGEESDGTIIDETNYEEDGQEEEVQAPLDVAGPSSMALRRSPRNSARVTQASSVQEQQVTRRVSKRQTVAGRSSNGPRNVETEPLSIITQKLKCPVPGCKKVVKSKRALNGHLLTAHKLKEHRCLVRRCYRKVSASFTTRAQLSDHLDEVHRRTSRTSRLACHCGLKFKSYKELYSHYWQYHELGLFACSKAGCTFKPARTRVKVQIHQYKHLEAKYVCLVDGCDRSFKQKCNLDSHTLTHTGERPFPCPECDKSFTRKGHLTAHLRIHRNDKCFRCTWPECTHSAVDRSAVIVHIRMVHFGLPKSKKQQAEEGIEDDRDPHDYLAKD